MAITLVNQPATPHSSSNDNYWVFSSDINYAPEFYIHTQVFDVSNNVLNTLLLPTTPANISQFNIKTVIDDYTPFDFTPFITSPTQSEATMVYDIVAQEYFKGFPVIGTVTGGSISNLYVYNNTTVFDIDTPALINSIGLVGVNFGTASSYVIGYATAGNGLVNSLTISSSPTASISVAASPNLSGKQGFLTLENLNNYSFGASYSTLSKTSIKANFDWEDYNISNNYAGRFLDTATSSWLTNAPLIQYIGENEYATLTYYNKDIATVSIGVISDVGVISSTNSTLQGLVTIPVGTTNLTVSASASYYYVRVVSVDEPSYYLEERLYKIDCRKRPDAIRLMWANRVGGVDYYTFNYITSDKTDAKRSDFDRNLTYGYTSTSRGITTYKVEDFKSYTVESDLLNSEQSAWLSEILTSKEVFLLKDGVQIPISIVTNSVQNSTAWEDYSIKFDFRIARTNRY